MKPLSFPRKCALLATLVLLAVVLVALSVASCFSVEPSEGEGLPALLSVAQSEEDSGVETNTEFNETVSDTNVVLRADPVILTADALEANLSALPASTTSPQGFGGYTLEASETDALQTLITTFDERGYSLSFVMMNLSSGRGVSYNADELFYPASSIKGLYIASLAAYRPELIASQRGLMRGSIDWSSNDSYSLLIESYGLEYLRQWCAEAGVENSQILNSHEWYPWYSSRDFAKLWLRNYEYFESGVEGAGEVRSWYSSPSNSAIYYTLNESYATYSKRGWIAEDGYYATCVGGVVYAGEHPYLLVMMSDIPSNMNSLNSLVSALDSIQANMPLDYLHTPEFPSNTTAETSAE